MNGPIRIWPHFLYDPEPVWEKRAEEWDRLAELWEVDDARLANGEIFEEREVA